MDRAAFFQSLRRRNSGVFGTSLSQKQVEGVEAILDAGAALPITHLAYALATAYGETGGRMQPVWENMNYSAGRIPQVFGAHRLKGYTPAQLARNPQKLANVVYSNMLGNGDIASGDGWRYRGGGIPQLTGKNNYRKFSGVAGADLVSNPEAIMDLHVGARVMIHGMTRGLFTGRKLSDYLPGDYVNARRVYNGTFAAAKYAGYARAFEAALIAGGYKADRIPAAKPPTSPRAPVTPQATPSQGKGLAGVLSWLLGKIFTSKGGPV
jgi:putative chitinase